MASKNIIAKGATYNGVESVTFPVSGGGNATFYEVSDTTAGASDVASGKYFYTSSGVKTEGTASGGSATLITKNITANGTYNASSDNADGYSSVTVSVSGGGGGLEYETGTWTPSANTESYFISFTNTHTVAPAYYTIEDATGTFSNQYANIHFVNYVNYQQITGEPIDVDGGTTFRYGLVNTQVRNGTNTLAMQNTQITVPYTDSADSTSSCSRFWAKETGILAYRSSGYYFRSDRTYKWIAVWAPTT
jgi:hypothetical protein